MPTKAEVVKSIKSGFEKPFSYSDKRAINEIFRDEAKYNLQMGEISQETYNSWIKTPVFKFPNKYQDWDSGKIVLSNY